MRDTYKYELWNGRVLVYVGTTNDPTRRHYEHSRNKTFTRMKLIGNRTTKQAAKEWERERLATYRKNHKGENPEYNHSLLGDAE